MNVFEQIAWGDDAETRYKPARFRGVSESGDWRFELLEPLGGSTSVWIDRRNVPDRGDLLFPTNGSVHRVFLRGQSVEAGNWQAEIWPRDDNPWLTDALPMPGEIVYGTVARLDGQRKAWVELDEPSRPFAIDGELLREDWPASGRLGSGSTLDLGDVVAAVVERIDRRHLVINLNCNQAIDRLLREARDKNTLDRLFDGDVGQITTGKKTGLALARQQVVLDGHTLIVFDDHSETSALLCAWAQRLGAKCETPSDLAQLERLLAFQDHARLLLVDYDGVACRAAIEIGRKHGIRTVLWSGHNEASKIAEEYGIPFERKPVDMFRLSERLRGREPPPTTAGSSPPHSGNEGMWTGRRPAGQVDTEAERYLERLCRRHKLLAALWLRREFEQSYSLQAKAGEFDAAGLTAAIPRLGQSVVTRSVRAATLAETGTAIADIKPHLDRVPPHDPIYGVVPEGARAGLTTCAFRFIEKDAKPRVVVFLARGEMPEPTKNALAEEYGHMRVLLQLFRMTEHADSIEAFAAVGRVYAATLHEVRNKVQALQERPQRVIDLIRRSDVDAAIDEAQSLIEGFSGLKQLVETDLRQVRRFRLESLRINDVVRRIVRQMRAYKKAQFPQSQANIATRLDPRLESLDVSLSPVVVERPLINLIDNGLHHVGTSQTGRIEIATRLSDEPRTPLHVVVRDNGRGISATEASQLFEARATIRGKLGTGIGLYASRNIVRAVGGELECVSRER